PAGSLGPGQRGAVRLRGVGRGYGQRRVAARLRARPVADVPQPVDRSRESELRRAQAVDEVAAADAALLLKNLQDSVDRGEAPRNALREHSLARHDAVS